MKRKHISELPVGSKFTRPELGVIMTTCWIYLLLSGQVYSAVHGGRSICVCLERFMENLQQPVFLSHAVDNGDIDRFFVLQKSGTILEFPSVGENSGYNTYLDLSDKVVLNNSPDDECGLLGIALHPEFAQNWKIYVCYMSKDNGQLFTVVSEFSGRNKYKADLGSEVILLKIPQPDAHQNGGQVFFGEDGFLYISVGDGGVEGHGHAQNSSSLLGKILRIDVNGKDGSLNYSIPVDNPYAGRSDEGRGEIFASGVRNMWRCSVDTGDEETGEGRGRIFCGDVGETSYEEINIVTNGGNYGWNITEGYSCREAHAQCGRIASEVLPIYVYPTDIFRAAVIGGYVYRGQAISAIHGQYIFGDASSGELFRLTEPAISGQNWTGAALPVCEFWRCPCDARDEKPRHILSFSSDKSDEIYVLTTNSLFSVGAEGVIYRLVPPKISNNDGPKCDGMATSKAFGFLFLCTIALFVQLAFHELLYT